MDEPTSSIFFVVCPEWHIARRCKSVMGVYSYPPIARSKAVEKEWIQYKNFKKLANSGFICVGCRISP